VSEYAAAIASLKAEEDKQKQVVSSLSEAATTNPDEFANMVKLSRAAKISLDAVPTYKEEAQQAKFLGDVGLERLWKDAPKTTQFLATPEHSKMASDDIENLSGIEGALNWTANRARAIAQFFPKANAGVWGAAAAPFELLGVDSVGGYMRDMQHQAGAQAKRWGPQDKPGWMGNAIDQGLTSFGQNAASLALAFMPGGQGAALASMVIPVFGESYGKGRDAGLSPAQSIQFGTQDAAAEYVFERFGLGNLVKNVKSGTGLGKTMVQFMMREVPSEMATTVVQSFDEYANINPNKPVGEWLSQLPDELAQTVVATLVGGSAISASAKAVQKTMQIASYRQQEAQDAESGAGFIETLNKFIGASTTLQRDPETFERFIEQATENGPVENIYINAQTLQQSGIAEQLAAVSPAIAEQFQTAIETGGDIRIPVAEYASKIAPTEFAQSLVDYLKVDENGFSRAEAQEYMQSQGEELQAHIERVMAENEGDTTFKASVETVKETIRSQLDTANRFTSQNNEAFSTLTATFFAVTAARLGMTPEALYAKYPLRVVAESIAGGQKFDQGRTLQQLRDDLQKQQAGFDAYDAEIRGGVDPDGDKYFGLADKVTEAMDAFVADLEQIPDDSFSLQAKTKDGRMLLVNPSAQKPGHYQLTRFASDGNPWGDTQYPTKKQAIKDFLDESDASTVKDFGGQLNQSARLNTDTPEFRNWFGESKVVDESGKPMVVYHGTASDITAFDIGRSGESTGNTGFYGAGAYFSEDADYASGFSFWARRSDDQAPNVVPVYLSLKNPAYINITPRSQAASEKSRATAEKIISTMIARGTDQAVVDKLQGFVSENKFEPFMGTLYNALGGGTGTTALLKEAGFDGVTIYGGISGKEKLAEAVAFDPTQIKSAIGNRGTFDPNDANILNQSAGPRMMAVHNLSADNLIFADKLGGLAVPSVGVVTEQAGSVDGFGEITLLGTQSLVDPAKERVFSSDAYTARFPKPEWPKAKTKDAQKLVDEIRETSQEFDDRSIIDYTWDNMTNTPDAGEVVSRWLQSNTIKALYLREQGIDVKPVRVPVPQSTPVPSERLAELAPLVEAIDQSKGYEDTVASPEWAALSAAYKQVITEKYKDKGRGVTDTLTEFGYGTLAKLERDIKNAGKEQVDAWETNKQISEQIDKQAVEFKQWVEAKVLPNFGEPFLKVGSKKSDYTLRNIVDAMTDEKVRGKEKTMTYGPGQVRAAASIEFSDLEQMRKHAEGSVADKSDYEAAREQAEKELSAYRDAVVNFTKITNWKGEPDIWEAMDGSMRALAKWATGKKRDSAALKSALRAEDFDIAKIPDEAIQQGIAAGNALMNAPVPYFEAKPQRSVGLDEFAGAVIPKNAPQAVRDILAKHNIEVTEYADEENRNDVAKGFAAQLNEQGKGTLFQNQQAPRGSFNPATLQMSLLKNADLSTFLHESGHFFLEVQFDIAAQLQKEAAIHGADTLKEGEQEYLRDTQAVLDWFGINDLNEWNNLDFEEKRSYHERYAESFEAYLFSGKAPSIELAPLFQKFRAFLTSVYTSLKNFLAGHPEAGKLNEEVIAVFDRMLATNEQILLAEQARSMMPLFDANDGTITPEEYASLQALGIAGTNEAIQELQAKGLRDLQWARNAKSRELRRLQRESKGIREELTMQARREIMSQPVYQVWSFLTKKQTRDDMTDLEQTRADYREILSVWNAGRQEAEGKARIDAKQEVWASSEEGQKKYRKDGAMLKAQQKVLRREEKTIDDLTAKAMVEWEKKNPKPRDPEARAKSDPDNVDESQDSLFAAIAKLGGINKRELVETWGIDPADKAASGVFGKHVMRAEDKGLSIDGMVEALSQYGYLTLDEHGKADMRELEDKFKSELGGDTQYSNAYDYSADLQASPIVNPAALSAGRLDMAGLSEIGLPPEIINHLKALRMTAKDGLHPDMVAEVVGDFGSGDEMVRAIVSAKPPKEAIADRAQELMEQNHGELANDEAIDREADKAIHNEVRARAVEAELNALAKATNQREPTGNLDKNGKPITRPVLATAAREFAAQMIGRLKVRDIKPSQYANSEAKAARAADKAKKAGDVAQAMAEKRNQLINLYLTKSAYAGQDEAGDIVRYLSKFDREGTRKALANDYLVQIDAILERFDLRKGQSLKAIDKRDSLAKFIESQAEAGIEPEIPEWLVLESNKMHYKNLTLDELRAVNESVRQIEHLGRLKNKLLTAKDARELNEIVQEISASMIANSPGLVDNEARNEIGSKISQMWRGAMAAHRKAASVVRQMDGFKDGGPMWEYFIRSMNEAGEREASMRADAAEKLHALAKPVMEAGKLGGKGKFFPALNRNLNRGEIIAMALNIGNESNLQRLLGGKNWTVGQIKPALDTLTATDWAFVQGVWDFFESYRPEIGAKQMRVYGTEPDWIEPGNPFLQMLSAEKGLQLRGGYYPVKYDPRQSGKSAEFDEKQAAQDMMRAANTAATTRRSFTKARVEEVKGRPLLLSFDGIWQGANEVIHDLTWHEWLIDANRLMKRLDEPMRDHYGAEYVNVLRASIKDSAQGDMPATNHIQRGLNHLRIGATVAGLGWNLTTSLLQPIGLTQSVVRIGAPWVARGLKSFYSSPIAKAEEVQAKSEFMRNRGRTFMREINDVRNRLESDKGEVRSMVESSFFVLIQKMQATVDYPTWLGAYEKAIAAGNDEDTLYRAG
jgi:hypothetical protein